MLKEFLSQRGITYREYDVSRDNSAAQELSRRTGRTAVPVTIIDGQTIIGFDRARLEEVLSQLRPAFGAAVADAGKITARQGKSIISGAYVGNVRPGSVAERLGLAPGDIITELNMQSIANADDLTQALSKLPRGSRITLVFRRGDEMLRAEGTL